MARKKTRISQRFRNRSRSRALGFAFLFVLVLAIPLTLFALKTTTDSRIRAADNHSPNILIILTDDQRWDTVETMPVVSNRLSDQAVTFTNSFATTPWCCPGRASILSGQYTHNHGVWTNHFPSGGFRKFKDAETIGVWMKRAGYQTGYFGKYLNEYEDKKYVPPGWNVWQANGNHIHYYNFRLNVNGKFTSYKGRSKYLTDVLTDRVNEFISTTQEPFFAVLAHKAPHGQGTGEDGNNPIPADRHRGTCENFPTAQPPSFNEEDVSDKPAWVRKLGKLNPADTLSFSTAQICALKAVDEDIAKILDTLEATGKRDNTVVIYTSDNGYSWGEHRYLKKNCLYEECARVPLIISYPPLTQGRLTSESFALNIDLAPTILDFAGLPIPSSVDGKSVKPILEDPGASVHPEILLEVMDNGKNYAVRTDTYKYTELATGEKELYDLQNDPYELQNQIGNSAYQSVIPDLAAKLAALKTE